VAFSEKCESQQSISRRLGVTQSTILRVQNRVRGTGANTRRLEKGYNAAQDRFLRLRTLKQRFVTSSSLSQDFSRRYNTQISQNTLKAKIGRASSAAVCTRNGSPFNDRPPQKTTRVYSRSPKLARS
jgi:hypothetical protein